jgi:hypothetical protein
MTERLQQAIAELEKLPAAEQDAIAALILDEIADEGRWDEAFARSQEPLGRLAGKVREDIRAGRVKNLGMDDL